jgi:hypothetical protein
VNKELQFIKSVNSVAPCSVTLWRPVNDLLEDSESTMRSVYMPTPKSPAPRLPIDARDDDVLEGFEKASEYVGNRRFRKLAGSLRDDFLYIPGPLNSEVICTHLFETINKKGGRFRQLDADGRWKDMSKAEATDRCRTALENGFVSLVAPPLRNRRRRGPGANVLETEIAPQYDLLSNRKRGSMVLVAPDDDDDDEVHSSGSKRKSLMTMCKGVADI